jgi:hypothetical protein
MGWGNFLNGLGWGAVWVGMGFMILSMGGCVYLASHDDKNSIISIHVHLQ